MYTQKEKQFFAPLEQECFGDITDLRRLSVKFAALDAIPDIPQAPPVNPDEYSSPAVYGYGYFMWGFPNPWVTECIMRLGGRVSAWLGHHLLKVVLFAAPVLLGVVFSIHL